MIAKTNIESHLRRMDSKYAKAKSNNEAMFYSKMAIIELSGWIEESMDDIILRCSVRCLKESDNRKLIKGIVSRNYSFQYEKFRGMLIQLIGLIEFEKLEKYMDDNYPAEKANFVSTLGLLKKPRNIYAHTPLKFTEAIDAPSVTKNRFRNVYEGLIKYDEWLRENFKR